MDTEAVGTPATKVSFGVRVSPSAVILAVILAGGLALRLFMASLPGFGIDLASFQFWSVQLADRGPWNFYSSDFFVDWAPGYMYVLWFIGGLDSVFSFDGHQFWYVLKLPSIAADLASAYVLYRILEGQKPAIRTGAVALYLLHPVVLLVGPVWGQVDSFLAFFLLLTVYYLAQGRTAVAAAVFTVGFLVKPQAVAALPVFAYWGLRDEVLRVLPSVSDAADLLTRARALAVGLAVRVWPVLAAALAAAVLIIVPFFPGNPFGIVDRLRDASEVYPYNSFYAHNFWGVATDWLRPDDITYLGLSYRVWGIVLFVASSLGIIWVFRDAKSPGLLALGTALSVMAFFLFFTRIHERYLFPSLLLLLTAAALLNSRSLWAAFGVLSLLHFFNVYFAYIRFTEDNYLRVGWLFSWIDDNVFLVSLLTLLVFLFLFVPSYLLASRTSRAGPT